MDVLSDILGSLRLDSGVFAHTELHAPWGIRAEGRPHVAFHILLRGSCWLEVDGREPAHVSVGDVILVAPGLGHTLRDALDTPPRTLQELAASGAFAPPSDGGRRTPGSTHLVCGRFQFSDPGAEILVSALPEVIHFGEMSRVGPWLEHTLKLVGYESAGDRPGNDVVVNRLCDALFVYVVRAVIAEGGGRRASWLRGLSDPQVGTAMRRIHESPARPWSVAELARCATMSRSAFAARFGELVGETPMRYLAAWRVQKAAIQLRDSSTAIAEIACAVGYESEAAFNKAFKRHVGVTPGAYRKGAAPQATVAAAAPGSSPSSARAPA